MEIKHSSVGNVSADESKKWQNSVGAVSRTGAEAEICGSNDEVLVLLSPAESRQVPKQRLDCHCFHCLVCRQDLSVI